MMPAFMIRQSWEATTRDIHICLVWIWGRCGRSYNIITEISRSLCRSCAQAGISRCLYLSKASCGGFKIYCNPKPANLLSLLFYLQWSKYGGRDTIPWREIFPSFFIYLSWIRNKGGGEPDRNRVCTRRTYHVSSST